MTKDDQLIRETLSTAIRGRTFDGVVLPTEVINRFLTSVKYVSGRIVHMRYVEIEAALSDHGFSEFLSLIGIDRNTFGSWKDHNCSGGMAARQCGFSPGDFCDPSNCHGN